MWSTQTGLDAFVQNVRVLRWEGGLAGKIWECSLLLHSFTPDIAHLATESDYCFRIWPDISNMRFFDNPHGFTVGGLLSWVELSWAEMYVRIMVAFTSDKHFYRISSGVNMGGLMLTLVILYTVCNHGCSYYIASTLYRTERLGRMTHWLPRLKFGHEHLLSSP